MWPDSSADPIHESGCVGARQVAGRAVAVIASALVMAALLLGLVLFGDPGPTPAMAADPPATSVTSPPSTGGSTSVTAENPPTTVTDSSVTSGPVSTDVPVSDPSVPVSNNDGGGQASQNTRDQGQGANSQDTTPPTSAPLTTTENLLVGAPPSTVTTTTIKSMDLTTSKVASRNAGSDPKIWAITAAMTLAAIVLAIATVLYWRRTRPSDDLDGGAGGIGKGGSRRSGRSRYSDLVITVPKSP